MVSFCGQLLRLGCSVALVVILMFFDFFFSCWPRRKRLRAAVKSAKKLYPWRLQLQKVTMAEYTKVLEERRIELLSLLDSPDFRDELTVEWICLVEERDRIVRLQMTEGNQADLTGRFVQLMTSLKGLLGRPDLSSAPISLHSSLIHTWQEVRRYLSQQQVDLDQLSSTTFLISSAQPPAADDDFNSALISAPTKSSSPLKPPIQLPPLATADICETLDELLISQLHSCYTPTLTDENLSVCTSIDTFDDRLTDKRRLRLTHRRFFPSSFSCPPTGQQRVVETAEVLQEKCRRIAATSDLD